MKRHLSPVCLLLSLSVLVAGQTPAPTPQSAPAPKGTRAEQEDVVRISINLVQVDVTVTDERGRQVTDLRPEDFEVFEEGRAQQITNFSYVAPSQKLATPTAPAALPLAPPPGEAGKKSGGKTLMIPTPVPPARLRPEQVRRTVALVVDDLGLSHESSVRVRQALRKFVDEQVQPGDLVAVIRTGAGMGALQQFTTDKRQLHAAIDRVRFNLSSRSDISAFAPIGGETAVRYATDQKALRAEVQKDPFYTGIKQPGRELNQFREELFSVGTLGALNFVVRGLKDLPGRKAVVLFSDGFKLYTEDPGNRRVLDNLRRLTDLANRASVVFYTIDPRGLQTFGITAADNLSGPITGFNGLDPLNSGDLSHREYLQDIEQRVADRRNEFFQTQHGLSYLATQTGGFLVKNNNDIEGAVRRVLNDQAGFYLIGYRPDDATFKAGDEGRRFRNIEVKVRRPGLRVRTRKGFYGFTDDEVRRPAYRNATEQLFAALTSPFQSGEIGLRMTALFGYDQQRGPFTQSMLHINARDLVFRRAEDGGHVAAMDIMAVTFGDNGKVVDSDDRSYTIEISDADFQRATRAGFVYIVTLPIKKPGAYQLRIAVRDHATSRVGSANQFIEVPDVKKGRLAVSGVTLRGVPPVASTARQPPPPGAPAGAASVVASEQSQAGVVDLNDPQTGPAGRRLRRGMVLNYGYYIYNAQLDKATRRPQVSTQVRLFRDGQLVYAGQLREYTGAAPAANSKQLVAGGQLQLGGDLQPGDYILQVVVVDRLGKGDNQLASQWIDFDIEK